MLGTAGIQSLQDSYRARRRKENGPRKHIVDPLAVRAVGSKRLPPLVDVVSPGIDEAAAEHLQLPRFGPELPDPSAAEPPHAPRRFDVAVYVYGLVEVQASIIAPAQRVQDVMRVLGAESRQ